MLGGISKYNPVVASLFSKTGALHKPLGFFMPIFNVPKTLKAWKQGMRVGRKVGQLTGNLRKAVYSGDGFYGADLKSYIADFATAIDTREKGKILKGWVTASGRRGAKSLGRAPKGMEALADDVQNLFYRTIKNDYKQADVQTIIQNTFSKHGMNLKQGAMEGAFSHVRGAQTAAYQALQHANESRRLLQGPTLMANSAALAIPTLAAAKTNMAVIKAMKRRNESIYDGYNGNVF